MDPTSYQSPAVLKEQFRAYLDKEGVIDGLTKALIALYETPVKPPSAVSFVKDVLGEREPAASADAAALEHDNAALRRELKQTQAALAAAREQLAATQRALAAVVDDGPAAE